MDRAQKTQLRIIAGDLRGRRLQVVVHAGLRPTPQMVREALFSILGNAIPERQFFDVFAGTGVVGLEAISRGASQTIFLERDFSLAEAIEKYLRDWNVAEFGHTIRTDVYRWAERWLAPQEPVNVFLSPPFPDLTKRPEEFCRLVCCLRDRVAPESVIVLQMETGYDESALPDPESWEVRKYGRNLLLIWQKAVPASAATQPAD